jgi:hypothetical protein
VTAVQNALHLGSSDTAIAPNIYILKVLNLNNVEFSSNPETY